MKLNHLTAHDLKNWRGERLQKEIADLVGVSVRTYEGWENGKTPSRFALNIIRRLINEEAKPATTEPKTP